jgi:eukaryotic-like serine/threonine-protein kinase
VKPGDTISRYRIIGPLGKGGMGVVYRAEDLRLNRPVALKFLHHDSISESDQRRFLQEARAAAAARHPNICPIYDIDEADGEVFIAMAFLEGETLHRRISRGPLDPGQAVGIAIQIANGLECAHQLGIVHRDIKGANIMIGPGGHASILDFGLALSSGATRITGPGHVVGTSFTCRRSSHEGWQWTAGRTSGRSEWSCLKC